MAEQVEEPPVNCSFCGKSQDEVRKMVANREGTVHICDECIDLCNDIIADECEREAGESTDSGTDSLSAVSPCIVCRLPQVATDLLLVPDSGFVCCACADVVRSIADAQLPPPVEIAPHPDDPIGYVAPQPCRLCRLVVATLDVPNRGGICDGCAKAVVTATTQRENG